MRLCPESRRWTELLARHTRLTVTVSSVRPVSGGCIHRALRIDTPEGAFFAKENAAPNLALFETEARSLGVLAGAGAVRVPRVVGAFAEGERAYLVLEYIEMGPTPPGGMAVLGEALACLHGVSAEAFGWAETNFIGSTPQANPWSGEWVAFIRDHRLQPMADRLAGKGVHFRHWNDVMENVDTVIGGFPVVPSLLHGDLWGGNAGFTCTGEPLIYDPASYYGHAETDLALTELFGGFSREFYDAYFSVRPREDGYARRRELYNLYHILNHALLFGGGYAAQAQHLIDRLARWK
ncbi:MAG: fructosamine kinase family protein [Opitutales bacterium]|nr:fructosamine kinase family protein [Opitutales bacterium]